MISELNQLTGIDISIFLIVIGTILLYFGKVIGDTKVEKYDKLGYYIEGLFFFSVYVFLPSMAAYYLNGIIRFDARVFIAAQFIILSCLSLNLVANEFLRKHEMLAKFRSESKKKLGKIKARDTFLGNIVKKYEKRSNTDYVEIGVLAHYKIPKKLFGNKLVLFLFSLIAIESTLYTYTSATLPLFGISVLFTFLILTMTAMAYGFRDAYYPPAKVYLDDGQVVEGKILKIGDFVYILKGDKKMFVNSDKIKYVEQSLFKEKESD